jgi:hypothetical protein
MKIWTYVRSRRGRYALTLTSLITALFVTIACDQPGQSATSNYNAVQVSPTPPGPTPTKDFASMRQSSILTEQAYEGAYATHDAIVQTQAAPTAAIYGLTYTALALGPTMTPLPVLPTATAEMGFFNCGSMTWQGNSCWSGTVGGHLLTVIAGRARGGQVGSLGVFHGVDMQYLPGLGSDEYYPVPCSIYSVGIASVDGTRFTVVPEDLYHATPTPAPTPVVLVFDLATDQWISSTCGPLPNLTTTP